MRNDGERIPAGGHRCEESEMTPGQTLSGFFPDWVAVEAVISRTTDRALHRDEEVDRWIKQKRGVPSLHTEIIPLERVDGWNIHPDTGNITHASGRFYSITGARARHRTNEGELEWDQPMIDQPEIGILGILAKKIDGVLHFCLQAKEEPGNIHAVQLSPTVQATYSNYTRVHGGSLPPFVTYFLDQPKDRTLFAKLQTEDGGRFLFKSNRNMIVLADEKEVTELPEAFIWLTLRQIARLIHVDNLINACCRSVLAALFFGLLPNGGEGDARKARTTGAVRAASGLWSDYADVIQWIDDRKTGNHILQKRIPLNSLQEWRMNETGYLAHRRERYFKIIGLRVTSDRREVATWCQPILDNVAAGIIGLLARNGRDGMEFLLQAKAELGNRSIIQIGPTVQFTQENYVNNATMRRPFLFEEFQNPHDFVPYFESRQSEEGARFYREEHVHRILLLPPGRTLELPPDYRWLTAGQIRFLMHLGEQVNSCCRSILACLL